MSGFKSQTYSAVVLPTVSVVEDDRVKLNQAAKNKQSIELPPDVNFTVDQRRLQKRVQQQQSYFKQWRTVRKMQYQLLILICLLLGLSVSALVVGIVNWFTLHSLQSEVNQNQ